MRELLPGIRHWTAFHEGIGLDVSSYYVEPARALIDPMLPPGDGLAPLESFFEGGAEPQLILLTNRHHYRHSDRFAERFGCPVLCPESGLHEFEGGPEVEGYRFGDRLAPGIVSVEVDVICPDDGALRIEHGGGALAFADGLVHWGGGTLGFVPDQFIGDDPEAVKHGLREALALLSESAPDNLLFAHGEPIIGGGREALRSFLAP